MKTENLIPLNVILILLVIVLVAVNVALLFGVFGEQNKAKDVMENYCEGWDETLILVTKSNGKTETGLDFRYVALTRDDQACEFHLYLLDKDYDAIHLSIIKQ